MPDISTRINALIAYLFLGPIILLARAGTPLADPYVRNHAKHASLIILIGIFAFYVYRAVRGFLSFGFFGISLDTIVLTIIVSSTLLMLMVGAYRAYSGAVATILSWKSVDLGENMTQVGDYSEEDKIRIIASFIPFIGIITASRYPKAEILIGRKMSNLFVFLLLTSIVFFSGTTTTLTLLLTLAYIALVVVTAVQLFGFSRFLRLSLYHYIPSYLELDAHIKATTGSVFDFCRVAFGGTSRSSYQSRYQDALMQNQVHQTSTIPYFAPIWITAIPGINLITLPSLWQAQYREYQYLILQGAMITLALIVILAVYGTSSQMGLYLLFPIVTLMVESRANIFVRAPFTSIVYSFDTIMTMGKKKIETVKEGEKSVVYTYETDNVIMK